MSFDPQDPKWTAYVVGELNERERESVEDELRSSPAARRMVDELRTLADSVKMAIANEPMPGLSREQRRGLLSAAATPTQAAPSAQATPAAAVPSKQLAARRPQPWGQIVFAFAAGLLIAAFCLPALQSAQRNIRIAQAPKTAVDSTSTGSNAHSNTGTNSLVANRQGIKILLEQVNRAAYLSPELRHHLGTELMIALREIDRRRVELDANDVMAYNNLAMSREQESTAPTGSVNGAAASASANSRLGQLERDLSRATIPLADGPIAFPDSQDWGRFAELRSQRHRSRSGDGDEKSRGIAAAPIDPVELQSETGIAAPERTGGRAKAEDLAETPIYQFRGGKREFRPAPAQHGEGYFEYVEGQMQPRSETQLEQLAGHRSGGENYNAPDAQNMALAHSQTADRLASVKGESGKSGITRNGKTLPEFTSNLDIPFTNDAGAEERMRIPAELPPQNLNTEAYEPIVDNPFLRVADNVLSTFSVDVDTASYSNLRRFLLQNRQLPPRSAVRIEELINYFPYQYAPPENQNEEPFAVHAEVAACPWNGGHRLLSIGIKGREIAADRRPATNLVFLLDVSGSMDDPHKLPLVKDAMRLLVKQLTENDRVAIVVYAGASGLAMPSTTGDQKTKILAAIDSLQPGGSTNGAQGIELAYDIAAGNFIKGGANRVILATDGDFNVGVTDRGELIRLIEEKAKTGVFLTALGFGMGNLKDNTLEQLADKGNGAYAYIDGLREARKVFVEQLSGTLAPIAKDVKLQLEFNPAQVAEYRLIGYENRALKNEDFNDDKKDAGDIGAGHTVTALYELVPTGKMAQDKNAQDKAASDKATSGIAASNNSPIEPAKVDALKYTQPATLTAAAQSGELLTLKLRYKQPEGSESRLIERSVKDDGRAYAAASVDFKFASAVALFGMLLRDSPYRGGASFDAALELAEEGRGDDPAGYRAEFLDLVRAAKQLKGG